MFFILFFYKESFTVDANYSGILKHLLKRLDDLKTKANVQSKTKCKDPESRRADGGFRRPRWRS